MLESGEISKITNCYIYTVSTLVNYLPHFDKVIGSFTV